MRIPAALSLWKDIYAVVTLALRPWAAALWARPSLLLHPKELSDVLFSIMWQPMGDGIDEGSAPLKTALITPFAHGVVLDIGSGHGHTAKYLDRTKVSTYVALEPNTAMHPQIRAAAHASSFHEADGSFILLSCGAEELDVIKATLKRHDIEKVDTIVSILSFCGVPDAERSVVRLISEMLRSGGGELLFYEHVRNPRADVAWWQDAWTPIWTRFFGGCIIGKPTNVWIDRMDCWARKDDQGTPGEEESLFPHSTGHYTRA